MPPEHRAGGTTQSKKTRSIRGCLQLHHLQAGETIKPKTDIRMRPRNAGSYNSNCGDDDEDAEDADDAGGDYYDKLSLLSLDGYNYTNTDSSPTYLPLKICLPHVDARILRKATMALRGNSTRRFARSCDHRTRSACGSLRISAWCQKKVIQPFPAHASRDEISTTGAPTCKRNCVLLLMLTVLVTAQLRTQAFVRINEHL